MRKLYIGRLILAAAYERNCKFCSSADAHFRKDTV